MTELLYLRDAYLTEFTATVVATHEGGIALDRTAFYPTGGGQPHDTGTLAGLSVTNVRKEHDDDGRERVWHTVEGGPLPEPGRRRRRHRGLGAPPPADAHPHRPARAVRRDLERMAGAHNGSNMEPLSARMDFEFDPVPEGFGPRIEELVNAELAADSPRIAVESSHGTPRCRTRTSSAPRCRSSPRA